ncbi:sigma-70 family RNA polymerase sigma factor [Myxococcota bacterium]|nr:sigma-70 family RNA polymerase sigma factor [Myxococcota bacterium]MCZ7620749.1 sigma-70 family RNA polymerase sigma factor [Myxococcota bacterium]
MAPARPESPNDPKSAPDPAAEERLVIALRSRDEDAYEQLVRAHGGRMLAVARRLLGDSEDAPDAVQEAFVSAFRSIDSFEGQARLSTWLHRIVVNAALMKLRTRRRKPEQPIDDLLPTFEADGHHREPGKPWQPAARLEQREVHRLVRENIAKLPDAYRTVLVLRDIEELDTAEVAALLEVNAGVVKTRLHRARQALRTLLDPHLRADRE